MPCQLLGGSFKSAVSSLCRLASGATVRHRSTLSNTSFVAKKASFRQLPPAALSSKFPNPLAGREFLPGSQRVQGFPEFLAPPREYLPVALQAQTAEQYSIEEWAQTCQDQLDTHLPLHGAVLFRGLPLVDANDFAQLTKRLRYTPTNYEGGTGNRGTVDGHPSVYVSTNDPPTYNNELHNEMACSPVHPRKVMFFCLQEPVEGCGGLTPIARNSEIFAKLDPRVVKKLEERKIRYSRYLDSQTETTYASWQQSFCTDDKKEVEQFLEREGFEYKWEKETGALSYWYTLPAFMEHPETGDMLWFNQPEVHHCTYYKESPMFQGVSMPDDKYPTHTSYGDGGAIEAEVIQHIRATGWNCAVGFQWKNSDLMVLDNLLMKHGKLSFSGKRKILAYLTKD